MQLSVKLFFEDEIRRVAIGDDNGDVAFKHLEEAISSIFPAVVGKPFKISWKDEDEDSITITTTPELHEAIRTQQKNFGVVKFQVALTKRTGPESNRVESEPHIVHAGVGCDECGVCPIPGTRYKCTVRFNFDLCSNCEAKGPQPYPMMKITKPHEATPSIVKDDGAQTSPFGCPFGPHGGRGELRGRGASMFGGRGCGLPPSPHHPFGGAFPYGGPPPPPFWGRGPVVGPSLGPSSSFGPGGPTPAPNSSVPRATEADTQAVHANIQCNECGVCPITGPRFKCTVRKNYDLCGKCEEGHRNRIGNLGAATGTEMCPMLKIAHPEQAPVDDTFVYAFAKHRHSLIYKELHHTSKHGVVTLPPAVHRFIRCDGCGCRPITGTRFKCTVRPDFDLCEHCEATRPQPYPMVKIYRARHRPAYIVYHPRDPVAAATFASRVTALNNGQAAIPLTTHSEPAAPPVAPAGDNAAAAVVHRHVSCDECGMSPIVGIRYKCSKRPNFDLCAGCEAKRPVQPYPMIMMTSPQGQLRSLRLEFQQPQAGATVDVNSDVQLIVITADHLPEEAAVPESVRNSSSNTPAPPAPRPILIQVHHGVRCDVCDQNPITGPRFKCTLREDYDLCGTCEAVKRGESTAPMLKIYDPAHHPSVMVCVFDAPPGGHHGRGFHHHRHGPDHGLHAGRGGGWGGRGGHWRARAAWDQVLNAASAAVAPAFVPTAPSAVPNLPKPALRFVRDVTLPDGTDVVGGAMGLKKVWLVRNDGQHQWPDGCRLVFAGGDALHEADPPVDPSTANLQETNACVPQVAMRFPPLLRPNEEGELRVTLNTPLLPGRFVSYFRMQTAEGQNFGQRVWSDLAVQMPDDMPVANEDNAEEDEDVEDVPIIEKPAASYTDEEDEDFARAMKEALQVHPSAAPLDVKQEEKEEDDDDDLLSVVLQESLLSSASAANSPPKHLEKEKLQAVREEEEEEDAEVLESDPLPADGLPVADADWAVVNHDCSDLFDDNEDEVSSPQAGAGSSVAVSGLVGSTLSSTGAATSSLSTSTILRASYENACADVDFSSDEEEDHEKLTSDLLNISIVSDGSLHDNNSNGDAALASPAVQSQDPPVQSNASSVAPFIAGMDRQSEQESSRRLWAREIEMIGAMGFCPNEEDLDDMLLPLLVKYAQSPADAEQGRAVNTDGLHTVLSVLLMSESSHK